MSNVTIYHNPRCSKSRQTLALLEERGIEIVLYLENTPSADQLATLIDQLGISARELLRKGEDAYKEQNLADRTLDDTALVEAMIQHPKLIERPIVVANNKAVIGRPPEKVLDIL